MDGENREIPQSLGKQVLKKITSFLPFSKEKPTKEEFTIERLPREPGSWYSRVLEGMSPEDCQSITKLRAYFRQQGPNQKWFYGGAGRDVTPVMIAPVDTEHWFTDLIYSENHHMNTDLRDKVAVMANPLRRLGASVTKTKDWLDVWHDGRQKLTVDGTTVIQLVAGDVHDDLGLPQSFDVIYRRYSPDLNPDILIGLKTGGHYLVCGREQEDRVLTHKNNLGKSFTDLGIIEVDTVMVKKLKFPKAGDIDATSNGDKVWFHIYQKTRAFTPEEENMLKLNSSLTEIQRAANSFIILPQESNVTPEIVNKMEERLELVLRRYFERKNQLKGNSTVLASKVQQTIDSYFSAEKVLPPKELSEDLANVDENVVSSCYQKTKQIYEEIKQESL